jgi:hypothetical protein
MQNSRFKRSYVILGCFLAAAGIAIFVLKLMSVPTGYIVFKYDGLSPSGVFVEMENRSTQAIYLKGNGNKIWASEARAGCHSAGSSSEGSDPVYFADGGTPSIIKVSPGDRVRLDIPTGLPSKYKGGFCRLRLSLLGGAFVESNLFTPK